MSADIQSARSLEPENAVARDGRLISVCSEARRSRLHDAAGLAADRPGALWLAADALAADQRLSRTPIARTN